MWAQVTDKTYLYMYYYYEMYEKQCKLNTGYCNKQSMCMAYTINQKIKHTYIDYTNNHTSTLLASSLQEVVYTFVHPVSVLTVGKGSQYTSNLARFCCNGVDGK